MLTLELNDGNKIPALGLGTWNSPKDQVYNAVVCAVKDFGYRHIDCAFAYQNEEEVGKALKFLFENNVVKREDMFIVSKLWSTFHSKERVPQGLSITLKNLGLDYLDLYLIHWPIGYKEGEDYFPMKDGKLECSDVDYLESYKAMIELKKAGKFKSIGVSNFNIQQLERIIKETGTPGMHYRNADYPKLLEDLIVKEIANKHKKTSAQVLIKFHLNRKTSVIPKSVTPQRIKENIDVLDFELDSDDISKLESLGEKNIRYCSVLMLYDHPYYPFK